jgi:hypothetical protein
MNYRPYLAGGLSGLLLFVIGSKIKAADAPAGETADQAIIYFSSAPWDGAAYSILIPLGHRDDAIQPIISINIWGYPQFPGPETIHFSGKEDSGGGPSKGDGRALFQAKRDKTMPVPLAGSISFKNLQNDKPVSGDYELATLDGKMKLKGSFQAAWGNTPPKIIR